VGRGHVSLLTGLDTCHSAPLRSLGHPLIYSRQAARLASLGSASSDAMDDDGFPVIEVVAGDPSAWRRRASHKERRATEFD
jgi:hypothetical protein